MGNGGMIVMDQATLRQWLTTTWGFLFRSQAQQMAMFERVIRMSEGLYLQYGTPHPVHPGITEHRGGSPNASPQGLGLLPVLMNAAAHLASGGGPAEVAERAVDMAQGGKPPRGAARQAAIQGAANAVKRLRPPRHQRRPPPSPRRDGGDNDDFDFEEPLEGYRSPKDGSAPGRYDDFDDDGVGGGDPGTDMVAVDPEISLEDLMAEASSDDLLGAIKAWVAVDPDSRKTEIMNRLPELTSLFA